MRRAPLILLIVSAALFLAALVRVGLLANTPGAAVGSSAAPAPGPTTLILETSGDLPVTPRGSAQPTAQGHIPVAEGGARPTPHPPALAWRQQDATTPRSPLPLANPRPTATPPPLSARYEPQPGDRVTLLRPGVVHIRRVTDDPLRVNLLLFDLRVPQVDLRVGLGQGWLSGRNRTSTVANEQGALAAVNGDLFGDSGLPQGLTIIDSRIVTAPKRRATFSLDHHRRPAIGYFTEEWTWSAEVVAPRNRRFPITLLNSPCPPDQICLFNQFARAVAAREGDTKVLIGRDGRVAAVVRGARVAIEPGARLLQGTGAAGRWLRERLAVGDRPQIVIHAADELRRVRQAISGGPIILRGGVFVQDCLCALRDCTQTSRPQARLVCEDFSTDWKLRHYLDVRMPRTGIGYDRAGQTLILAVVDGYQRGYSRGITQADFAALLREFGADTAMELDGGGSSTMVIEGRVVNRPPDETGERYVANALLFFWRDPED